LPGGTVYDIEFIGGREMIHRGKWKNWAYKKKK
jgi:hypothetical protein